MSTGPGSSISAPARKVFVTGGSGYLGRRLIPLLLQRGCTVTALVRPGSERKLAPHAGLHVVAGDALNAASYRALLSAEHTFIQLVGVAHPSPAKARQFVEIDERSAEEAVRVSRDAGVRHFIYVSVAHPAPAMHAYIAVRSRCEAAIREAGLNATILRPWYVLGPGHYWPYALLPFYWAAERIPATAEGAKRLGLITQRQMTRALVYAVENPARGVEVLEVPRMRAVSTTGDVG